MKSVENGPQPAMTGNWGAAAWEFFPAETLPDLPYPCTGAAAVVIRNFDPRLPIENQEVVLTSWVDEDDQTGRAGMWEIVSGHTDPLNPDDSDSTLEHPWQALKHEAPEEGGVIIHDHDPHGLAGYSIVTNPPGADHPEKGTFLYYWIDIGSRRLVRPTETEYTAVNGTFLFSALESMAAGDQIKSTELEFVRYALAAALRAGTASA